MNDKRPSKKLGVKYLDRIQMQNTFPDYGALMQRVKDQREMLLSQGDGQLFDKNQASAMYDNVFAILGGRGAGKSSALLTLSHYLAKECPANIQFPIITPEIISDKRCSILGWIMATAESILENLENRIKKEGRRLGSQFSGSGYESLNSRCGIDFFKDCGFQRQNKLRILYDELCETIQSDPDISRLAYEDIIGMRTADLRQQYQLRQNLNEFWTLLTRAWSEVLYSEQQDMGKAPDPAGAERQRSVIVMMFDDIDLVPERSMELLSTTFQFLSNVNIVIILTAAERVLNQVIYMKMFERMIGSNYHSLLQDYYPRWEKATGHDGSAPFDGVWRPDSPEQMDSPGKMMIEFYNKVIPPANRYHLRRYSTILEREQYSYPCIDQSFTAPEEEQAALPIAEFLESQMLHLCRKAQELVEPKKRKAIRHSFLQNTGGKTPRFRQAYLVMFGDKNRNIANGCLEIMNAAHRISEIYRLDGHGAPVLSGEQRGRELESTMRHLLRALVFSKDEMRRYDSKIDELIHCSGIRNELIYVNYAKAVELYKEECAGILSREKEKFRLRSLLAAAKQRIGTLMVMLFFIENILLLFDTGRGKVHGYRELTEILNSDLILDADSSQIRIKLFRDYQNVEEFLDESPLTLDYLERYTTFSVFDSRYARDYLQNTMGTQTNQSLESLLTRIDQDNEWVRTILLMLFIQHSGITLADRSFLLTNTVAESCKVLDLFDFGGSLNKNIHRQAQNFLKHPNLAGHSRRMLKDFLGMYISYRNNRDRLPDPSVLRDMGKRDKLLHAKIFELLKSTRLTERNPHSTAKRANYLNDACRKDPNLIKEYTVLRWMMVNGDLFGGPDRESDILQSELCYRLIAFVEDQLKTAAFMLQNPNYWRLALSPDEFRELRDLLWRMDDFTYSMKRQKDTLIGRLDRVIQQMDDTEKQDLAPYYDISTEGFVKYLMDLHSELFESPLQGDDDYRFVQLENVQGYFTILNYLRFYEIDVDADVWTDAWGELDTALPLSSFVVAEVKMLEFLQPCYLAARFGIAMSRLYQSERVFLETAPSKANHRNLTKNEQMLRELYHSLSFSSRKELKSLCGLMSDVREDTARQYYKHLEEQE